MKKKYCFTIDDNIRFFEEALHMGAKSVFDVPYMLTLQQLHRQFSVKIQLNMFYSYTPHSLSLADVPDCYRQEFEAASSWLKLSFHARHNEPPFPYYHSPASLPQDYQNVMSQLLRIAGPRSLAKTTTLHYPATTREMCSFLKSSGVDALIGMFYDMPYPESLSYCLPCQLWPQLRCGTIYHDSVSGISFAHNDLILNQHDMKYIQACIKNLDYSIMRGEHAPFIQLMTHEQYFYCDYINYQPDWAEKIACSLAILNALGYQSIFLEELL